MFQGIRQVSKGIFVKFVLMFILVGLIPIMGMSYLIFDLLPEEIESYMVASYEESLLYASKNIELKLQAYDLLTRNIYQYNDVDNLRLIDVLRGEDYDNLTKSADNFLEDYLRSLLNSDHYIESAFLLGSDQDVLSYYSKSSSYYYESLNLEYLKGFDHIYDDKRALTVLPSHKENYFQQDDKSVITFVRHCLDLNLLPNSEKIMATLLIDVNSAFVEEIISRMDLNEKGEIYIVDGTAKPIYMSNQNGERAVELFMSLSTSIEDGDRGYQIDDNQYHFYQKIEGADWWIIFNVDQSSVMQLINNLSKLAGFIIIAIVGALIFVAITFSNSLSKPIRSIINQMKSVSAGDLDTKVQVKASYEVTQLADAFNHMTDQLRLYIDQAYGAQIKQKEAELNGLKTQIRPHYLYNTLEIIRMSALEESADVTKEMIVSLSEQLKYVIGQYGDKVTLRNELDMIQHYFTIIERRYEGRISLEIDVPKEFYDYQTIKLILQPLVENAVVHGLKLKEGKGKVKVTGRLENQILVLDVLDDGVGMSQETFNKIQILLEGEQMGNELDGHWENIGLKNVHDRLKMTYGADYGLTISSRENLGTKMSIKFPIN